MKHIKLGKNTRASTFEAALSFNNPDPLAISKYLWGGDECPIDINLFSPAPHLSVAAPAFVILLHLPLLYVYFVHNKHEYELQFDAIPHSRSTSKLSGA